MYCVPLAKDRPTRWLRCRWRLPAHSQRPAQIPRLRLWRPCPLQRQRPPHPPAFLELSGALCAAGRYGEALGVLDQALGLMPRADGLRIALGHIHLKLNDRARARSAFEHVRAAAPGRRDALVALAKLATLEGDYAEAAALYRQALAKQPDDPPSRISLGKCLLELGRRDEGEAIIRRAIHDAPSFAPLAISALAGASHGRLFLRPSAALAFLGSASS